jgi:hypothetical protein
VGDLDAPSVPDGAEHRLLVVPPDPAQLEVVVPAERAAAAAVTPRSTRTSSSRPVTPCWVRCSSISSLARFSWVEAGTTRALTGSPVTSTATTRLAPFVRPYGPPRSWKVNPPLDAPRARCVSMTTIDGVASARPSASRAAACSTVSARVQVPLRDQRRNCDHTRVQGPNDSGR